MMSEQILVYVLIFAFMVQSFLHQRDLKQVTNGLAEEHSKYRAEMSEQIGRAL